MSCCRPVTGACVHAAALSEAPKQQRNALRFMQPPPRHLPGCRFEGHPSSTYHARAAPPSFDIDEPRAGPTRAARPAPPRIASPPRTGISLLVIDQLTSNRDPRRILAIALGLAVILAAAAGGEY